MSVTLVVKSMDAASRAAVERWTATVTRCAPSAFDPATSSSDLLRVGRGPLAGAWKRERSAARKARRLERLRAAEAAFVG